LEIITCDALASIKITSYNIELQLRTMLQRARKERWTWWSHY